MDGERAEAANRELIGVRAAFFTQTEDLPGDLQLFRAFTLFQEHRRVVEQFVDDGPGHGIE